MNSVHGAYLLSVKHKCVKANLDSILKPQLKCESMKACKNTQAKHMRFLFYVQIEVLLVQRRIPEILATRLVDFTFS